MYVVELTGKAQKDLQKAAGTQYFQRITAMLVALEANPFEQPVKSLRADLSGFYFKRINRQHRLVYTVRGNTVTVVSCWGHY